MVEWDGLENRCGLRSTEGSNPSLPARKKRVHPGAFLFPRDSYLLASFPEQFSVNASGWELDGPSSFRD